jgi:crotonobetainyl-CoA:carnitine CoA-transferase CaiB-like acyl-CoA transferase
MTLKEEIINPPQALKGLKVLEYSQFISAAYCTKLLADFGADVIKVEPPEGDKSRCHSPFYRNVPDKEISGLFLYLNTNKLGTTLNLDTKKGRIIFRRLVEQVDILVENYPVGTMKQYGLDYESLKQENPRLIMISITPFGQDGPYSQYKSYPLNTFHAGGEGYCLPGGIGWELNPDREPIKAGGYLGEYDAGIVAAMISLAAFLKRNFTEKGEFVEISQQETLLSLMCTELGRYSDGWVESRATRRFPIGGLMQCKDGFVQVMPFERRMWDRFMTLLGDPSWSKDEKYDFANVYGRPKEGTGISGAGEQMEIQKEVNRLLAEWVLKHTKEEIYYGAQEMGISIGIVCSTEDIIKSKQLESRRFFTEIEHPKVGKHRYPGSPFKMSLTPSQINRPAPLLGEHNEEIYCKWLGFTHQELTQLAEAKIV